MYDNVSYAVLLRVERTEYSGVMELRSKNAPRVLPFIVRTETILVSVFSGFIIIEVRSLDTFLLGSNISPEITSLRPN